MVVGKRLALFFDFYSIFILIQQLKVNALANSMLSVLIFGRARNVLASLALSDYLP